MTNYTVVGFGNLGKALSYTLLKKGRLHSIISKHLPSSPESQFFLNNNVKLYPSFQNEVFESNVFLFSTKENEILSFAKLLCEKFPEKVNGKIFIHHSGIYGKGVFSELQNAGAIVASAHPLQTFYRYEEGIFDKIFWVVDCDDEQMIIKVLGQLGGKIVLWKGNDNQRALYHTAAVISSNVITGILYFARNIVENINLPSEIFIPLIQQTVENVWKNGESKALPLTGPIARRSFDVIEKHFYALKENPFQTRIYLNMISILAEITSFFSVIDEHEKEVFLNKLREKFFL